MILVLFGGRMARNLSVLSIVCVYKKKNLHLFVRLIEPSVWLGIMPIEISIVIIQKTKFMTTIALGTDQRRLQVVPQKAKLTCRVDLRHFCLKGRELKKRRRNEPGRLGTLSVGPNLPDLLSVPLETHWTPEVCSFG